MNQKQPRIVIVNVWHDDNKGDGGICEGLIISLKQRWSDAELSIVSMMPYYAPVSPNAHRHLRSRFPDLKVFSSPFVSKDPSYSPDRYGHLRKLWHIPNTLWQLVGWLPQSHPALNAIANAELVISNGGQYIYTSNNYFASLFRTFRNLYPFMLAGNYRVPYVLFSQSYDFRYSDRLDDKLVRNIESQAQKVFAREQISLNALIKEGIPKNILDLIPDAAFALKPNHTEKVRSVLSKHQLEKGKFWTITVRKWGIHTDDFLEQMAVLINRAISQQLVEKIVLVAQTLVPSRGENDRLATQKLAQKLDLDAVSVIEDDLSPWELVAFYGEAELMLGTRFHSVIFALVGGTPAYAVSYAGPKTWGIMEMLDMKHLCTNMSDF
ncbi:MAG: polysaccharide pyruvyl transferase family protein, partial [Pleurocapsa sp.]